MLNTDDIKQISQLLDEKISPVNEKITTIQKELGKHGKLLKSLKKDQDTMLDMLDKEQMQQRKRLQRLEVHTGLNPSI